jgi:hypothetical protein
VRTLRSGFRLNRTRHAIPRRAAVAAVGVANPDATILALGKELTLTSARHPPPDLGGLPRALSQRARTVVALNDVNIAPAGHHEPRTPSVA